MPVSLPKWLSIFWLVWCTKADVSLNFTMGGKYDCGVCHTSFTRSNDFDHHLQVCRVTVFSKSLVDLITLSPYETYHGSSTVSAPKSDLTVFCPPLISINFFFVENLWGFCRPQVSLLTPIILLYDRRIWPWIIYDWFTSAVYASPNYRWIFLRPWGPKLRKNHGTWSDQKN